MSKIDKMQILGVRSFGHKKPEAIQFFSPLTLIVGWNGSGKTTIIECLRYATTGELPPNSGTGGAWIHDPKLAGENEVLAQVKLSFDTTSGTRMVLSRSLQLTVKKLTRQQKSLDSSLQMTKNGERTTISSRVAELDQIVPQYLGASKAILESVIFCHQDDSLWPMSTPTLLKKKFDEIFEAQKYTRAVDNIKVIRKNQMTELEKFKLIEQHSKEDKDKGEKAEKKSQILDAEMGDLRDQEMVLRGKIKDAKQKSEDAWGHAARFEKIVTELAGKRIEVQAVQKSIASLKQHMQEMTDSDDALREMEEKYDERLALHEQERDSHKNRYLELNQDITKYRRDLGTKQSEVGRYQAQKDQYERQVISRTDLIKETARRHNVRGFDGEIEDHHVQDFMEKIAKMARDQNNAFDRARKETQDNLQAAQQSLNALAERRSALNQTKAGASSFIQVNDGKISRALKELDKIDIDEGGRTVLESNVADLESRLSQKKSDFETAQWDKQVKDSEKELRELDDKKERLDGELMEASRQAKDSARLDYLRKEMKDRQQSLDTNSGAHGARITSILGSEWNLSTLDASYQAIVTDKNSSIKDAEAQRDGISRELEQLKFKLSTASNQLKQMRQNHKESKEAVCDAINDDNVMYYEEAVTNLETNLDTLKHDQTGITEMKRYYNGCLNTVNERGLCQLCTRPFKITAEKDKFITRLNSLVRKAQEDAQADVIKKELEEAEQDYTKVKEARLQYDTYLKLEAEIPKCDREITQLENSRDALNAKLEQQDQVVQECVEAKRDVDSLSKTIQNICKYHSEIGNFASQIKDLESMQKAAGLSRGIEKIQEEQKKINEQARSMNTKLQQLRTDRERARGVINGLELEVRDVRSRLSTAMHQLKEKDSLQRQIEELKAQNSDQRDSIKRADQEVQALLPQISQAEAKLEDIRARGEERDKLLQKEASKLTDSLNQLRTADQEISSYIDRGGPQQLARASREISNLEEEINRVEDEQRRITVEMKKVEQQIAKHSEIKRAIADNLTYRENVKHLQELKNAITELDSSNAEADKDRWEREGGKWQNERNKLSAEQATLIGILRSKDDQLQQLLQEWETDYKDAAEKYRESHIRVVVTKAAIDDLARYGGALDKAIMKYHSLKMEEINRIIDELWRNTYQGTDVDTIMIRSENETQKGNKSYNYRVVMVKQDAEMDMRGRCSAGQKVLASIIIRLALAECFGVRCGLIALDEPTTNLDRDNIRALAESLSEIIRVRKQQHNFQLIVITHDEDFLRYMNCAEFCDHYYRVSRKPDQTSQIEKQSIQKVRFVQLSLIYSCTNAFVGAMMGDDTKEAGSMSMSICSILGEL
jgi:DNA repair protein RAD50